MTLTLLQMTAVLLTALLCGAIARKLHQPRVIGEILGGILLGPSAFGRIAPQTSAALFPPNSLGAFDILSTLGLILFLFLIGTQLEFAHLRHQRTTATLASGLSILIPFLLAAALAPALRTHFAPPGVPALPFTLFLGVAMSITAFPVLARILEERKLQSTPLGTTALMCAAVDDVAAWTLLAAALTLLPPTQTGPATSPGLPILIRLLSLALYLLVMLGLFLPLGQWITRRQATHPHSSQSLSYDRLALLILIALASAAATEAIGLHPLFGAFLAGICFPRIPLWQSTLKTRLDTTVSVLLLPFFFALTGMRTRLDLLASPTLWLWTALIVLLAITGKIGGAILAARLTGQSWQHACALGALLNTRGLVELIVLNVAYNAHVFSETLFTILVLMAILTTLMTAPLLNLLKIQSPSGKTHPGTTANTPQLL